MKIALLNHGCAKNLVDSELMLGLLAQRGHQITLDEKDADIVVVNTCSLSMMLKKNLFNLFYKWFKMVKRL